MVQRESIVVQADILMVQVQREAIVVQRRGLEVQKTVQADTLVVQEQRGRGGGSSGTGAGTGWSPNGTASLQVQQMCGGGT